jgi:hypothetical protein
VGRGVMLEIGGAALDLDTDDSAGPLRITGQVDVEVSSVVASPVNFVYDHAVALQQTPDRVDTAALGAVTNAKFLPRRRLRGSPGHEEHSTAEPRHSTDR